MMQTIKNIIYDIDSSDKTNHVTTLLQVIAGGCAFFYSINHEIKYVYGFIGSFLLVFIILALRSFLSFKYGTLKLYLNRDTGVLFDKKASFRNVSLRKRTIQLILESLCKSLSKHESATQIEEGLYNAGIIVGENFHAELVNHLRKKEKSFDKLSFEKKLKIWADYDSSSGMGKFYVGNLVMSPKMKLNIEVQNAFTCPKEKKNYDLCKFFCGYIAGFCTKLLQREVDVKEDSCGEKTTDGKCSFTLLEKE